ncbi:MAG: hypothetical protein R3B70_25305 [Polyangiaceae bacterium]
MDDVFLGGRSEKGDSYSRPARVLPCTLSRIRRGLFFEDGLAGGHHIDDLVALLDLEIGLVGVDSGGDVGGQCPGGRGPGEERLSRAGLEAEPDVGGEVRDLPVSFGGDLVLGEAGTNGRTRA